MNYFITKGLGKDEHERVKLHATVLNTKLRETNGREQTSRLQSTSNNKRAPFPSRTSFDARKITEVGITDVTRKLINMVYLLKGLLVV